MRASLSDGSGHRYPIKRCELDQLGTRPSPVSLEDIRALRLETYEVAKILLISTYRRSSSSFIAGPSMYAIPARPVRRPDSRVSISIAATCQAYKPQLRIASTSTCHFLTPQPLEKGT